MELTVAANLESLQQNLAELAKQGLRIALVPTMGALHEGHATLIKRAAQDADAVVVSIFVNPRQFGPSEDFEKYPRVLDNDIQKIHEAGGTLIYAPPVEDLYPEGFSTTVSVGGLNTMLCGASRPGHFDGVATVVTKLLLRTLPHAAFFGEKDYQQLCVIRKLVDELDIPVEINGVPTVREADGLAMSSRNTYLTEAERMVAPKLYEVLCRVGEKIGQDSGRLSIREALAWGATELAYAGFRRDYLELRDAYTLEPVEEMDGQARLLAAVWLGNTRLIDNIAVG